MYKIEQCKIVCWLDLVGYPVAPRCLSEDSVGSNLSAVSGVTQLSTQGTLNLKLLRKRWRPGLWVAFIRESRWWTSRDPGRVDSMVKFRMAFPEECPVITSRRNQKSGGGGALFY